MPAARVAPAGDGRVEVGQVAVRPALPVRGRHRQPDAAASARVHVRPLDRCVRERVDRCSLGSRDVGGGIVVVVVRDRDHGGAASDREDVGAVVGRRGQQRARRGCERGRERAVLREGEVALRLLEPRTQVGDATLSEGAADGELGGSAIERQSVGQQARAGGATREALLGAIECPQPAEGAHELPVRSHDLFAGPVERDLQAVEVEGRVNAARAKQLGELQNLVHVPLRVVVREDCAGDIGRAAARGEVARRRGDRVVGAPRVRYPVAVGVHAPALPRRRHELHPADRAGGARAHVAAEVRLDLVDRGQHLPRHPVDGAVALPEPEQLWVAAGLGDRGRGEQRRREADRARCVRHLRARQERGRGRRRDRRHDLEHVRARRAGECERRQRRRS